MELYDKILSKTFPPVKGITGKVMGYQKEHVDLFLEQVNAEIEEVLKERAMLAEKLQIIDEEQQLRGTNSSVGHESEEVKKRMKQLERMERSFKRIIYIAENEADEIKEEAKEEAHRLITEAQNRAQALMKEANIRSQEKQKEIQKLLIKEDEIKNRLNNIADFINQKKAAAASEEG